MLKMQDFEFVGLIGTGAFGKVYKVRYREKKSVILAVKILNFRRLVIQRMADQLRNEIFVLKQLHGCPFAAKLFSVDFQGEETGLILEYIGGGELFYWIKKYGRFSESMTRFYAAEVVCALRFMHERGIIYRDLKPENILLTSAGHVKLVDFGFSVRDGKGMRVSGTPEYMSPEKLNSEDDGRESDYWGLGVLVYEMLCGDPPFYGSSLDETYHKILNEKIVFPNYVSSTARDFISSLLEKNRVVRLGFWGINEIEDHPFFIGICWDSMRHGGIEPPFLPVLPENDRFINNTDLESESSAVVEVMKPYKHTKQFSKSNILRSRMECFLR